jgi:hypothetical protein
MCDSTGVFKIRNMSHIDDENFNELFKMFIKKFPPAGSLQESQLKFTTREVGDIIFSFMPGLSVLEDEDQPNYDREIFDRLKEAGYNYEPVEYNEKVTFYWLFKKSKEEGNF